MGDWWADEFARTYKEDATQEEALAAGERLLARPDFPHQEQLRKNLTYWLPKLPGTNHDITIPVEEGWSCFNPSIAADPDGNLRAIIRTANYVMSAGGWYGGAYDDEQVIRTENWITEPFSDPEGAVLHRIIDDKHLLLAAPLFPVIGFEDCRLFWHDGWKFSATMRERNARGICQQVMCDLDGNRAEHLVELSPAHDIHEKNWMPRPQPSHELAFIRHCYPTTLMDGDGVGYGFMRDAPYIARHFRGGAAIDYSPGDYRTLAVVHESIDFPGQTPHRVYWHRFLEFDVLDMITKISQPFCFQRRGVEFCAGMALKGDDLILSYGVHDQSAWLHRMPLQTALDMMHPVTEE